MSLFPHMQKAGLFMTQLKCQASSNLLWLFDKFITDLVETSKDRVSRALCT